jgi:hypothetical protein
VFRMPKGVPPRPDRRHRRRQAAQRSRLPGHMELLEERSLLSGTAWSVSPFTFTAQEGSAIGSGATGAQVATITDPSHTLTASSFSASINWGDGVTTAGTVAGTTGTFAVYGTHTYSEEGSDTVRVTITHNNSTDTPFPITETVAVSDPAVVPTGGMTFNATEGAAPQNQLIATFTDPGGSEAVSDYSATINWGDFTSSAATITASPDDTFFLVTGGSNHVYTDEGSYTITVVISHDSAPKATTTSTAIVSDPSVVAQGGFTYTGLEGGVAYNETVATFTDPGGTESTGNYSATIVWGDGATTTGSISRTGIDYTVSGAHSFAEEGSGNVVVTVDHGASLPVTVTGTYSISDAPLLLTAAAPIAANEGIPLVNVPVATFVDLGGAEKVADYSAQIEWGDGIVSPGTVSYSTATGTFTITGDHLYSVAGHQTIVVTLHHDSLSPDAAILGAATVGDPSVIATGNYNFTAAEALLSANQPVATFTDPGGDEPLNKYSATVNWGDGTTADAGTITFNSISDVFTVSGQHTYAEEGAYPITVVLNHDVAASVSTSSTAKVADQAVVASGGATATAQEFRSFGPQTLAIFTDPAGNESIGDYSATINWGDGTSSPGTIVQNAGGSSFSVLGSHTFTQLGTQTVSVAIHHDTAPDTTVQSKVAVSLPQIVLTTTPLMWREWSPLEAPDNALATISFVDNNTTVTIDWGDGTTSTGSVSPYVVGGAGAALGSHTWTETGTYNVTVTVNDGPANASATFPVTVAKNILPIANPNQATPNEYYVAELYEDILKRFVDGGGLTFWSGLLDQGVPRMTVVEGIMESPEYLTNFVIGPDYLKYLGRPADAQGAQYWVNQIHAGLTDEGLIAALASSPEFYSSAGGGTNAGYVDALYRVVLGRTSDTAGEAFWLGKLTGGMSAFSVALGFASSTEDDSDLIQQTYFDLLGRNPTPAELNQWLTNFQSGLATNESLIASVAATDEYFFRAVNE